MRRMHQLQCWRPLRATGRPQSTHVPIAIPTATSLRHIGGMDRPRPPTAFFGSTLSTVA